MMRAATAPMQVHIWAPFGEWAVLVRGNDWRQLAVAHTDIRQAYLAAGNKASVRVRINDNGTATLAVKSRPAELRRLELEYAIPARSRARRDGRSRTPTAGRHGPHRRCRQCRTSPSDPASPWCRTGRRARP